MGATKNGGYILDDSGLDPYTEQAKRDMKKKTTPAKKKTPAKRPAAKRRKK